MFDVILLEIRLSLEDDFKIKSSFKDPHISAIFYVVCNKFFHYTLSKQKFTVSQPLATARHFINATICPFIKFLMNF